MIDVYKYILVNAGKTMLLLGCIYFILYSFMFFTYNDKKRVLKLKRATLKILIIIAFISVAYAISYSLPRFRTNIIVKYG